MTDIFLEIRALSPFVLFGDLWPFYSCILFLLAIYSFYVSRKRQGKIKIIFLTFGVIFSLTLVIILSAPNLNMKRPTVTTKLKIIKKAQTEYFNKNKRYATTLEELNIDFSSKYWDYKYFLNDKNLISELGLNSSTDHYLAVAKLDELGGVFTKTSYCPDIWVIGNNTALTHVKKYECKSINIMSFVEALIFGIFALIAFAFMLEQIRHLKKRN